MAKHPMNVIGMPKTNLGSRFLADWPERLRRRQYSVCETQPHRELDNAVRDNGVVMLQADVTNRDAPAGPLLGKLNAGGAIPLGKGHAD
jgi:hypothetical protein